MIGAQPQAIGSAAAETACHVDDELLLAAERRTAEDIIE
jgi:hypothetical protein